MSASSPSISVTAPAPALEVDTNVGTLSNPNTPSAAELNVLFYSKEREKVEKALEKAEEALKDAELALLESRGLCFSLHRKRAKLRVRQAKRDVQTTRERLARLDKMHHEWNLSYGVCAPAV